VQSHKHSADIIIHHLAINPFIWYKLSKLKNYLALWDLLNLFSYTKHTSPHVQSWRHTDEWARQFHIFETCPISYVWKCIPWPFQLKVLKNFTGVFMETYFIKFRQKIALFYFLFTWPFKDHHLLCFAGHCWLITASNYVVPTCQQFWSIQLLWWLEMKTDKQISCSKCQHCNFTNSWQCHVLQVLCLYCSNGKQVLRAWNAFQPKLSETVNILLALTAKSIKVKYQLIYSVFKTLKHFVCCYSWPS